MKQKKKIVKKSKVVKGQNKLHNKFSKNLLIGIGILFITLFIIVAASNQRQSLLGNAQSISPTFGSIGDCNANGNCPTNAVSPSGTGVTISAAPSGGTSTTITPCTSTNSMVSIMAKNRGYKGKNGNGKGNSNGFVQLILQFFQLLLQLLQQLFGGGTVGSPGNQLPSTAPIPSGVQPSSAPGPSQSPCPPGGSPQPSTQQPSTPQTQPTAVPTSAPQPTTPVTSQNCTTPKYTIPMDPNNAQAGVTLGNFYLSADTWNAANYQVSQTVYACDYNNWYAVANMNNNNGDGAVKTSPNIHEDFNNKPISSFSTITSNFAESGPHVGIYEFEYDMWLNGVATNGSTEIMIWNDNFGQTPSGSIVATFSDGGHTYNVWKSGSYIAFVAQNNFTSGTVNILNFYNFVISKGWIPANSTVGQIDYGIELVSTGGSNQTFKVTNFTLTAN